MFALVGGERTKTSNAVGSLVRSGDIKKVDDRRYILATSEMPVDPDSNSNGGGEMVEIKIDVGDVEKPAKKPAKKKKKKASAKSSAMGQLFDDQVKPKQVSG